MRRADALPCLRSTLIVRVVMIIPGMVGPQAVVSGGVVPALQSVSETISTSSSTNISWPADREIGDVYALIDGAFNLNLTPPPAVLPSGFTQVANETDFYSIASGVGYASRLMVSYRMVDGTESGNISGLSGAERRKFLIRYRGVGRPIRQASHFVWTSEFGSAAKDMTVDPSGTNLAKAIIGCSIGYEARIDASPGFDQRTSQRFDIPGGGLDYVYWWQGTNLFDRNTFSPFKTYTVTRRAVRAAGILAFS